MIAFLGGLILGLIIAALVGILLRKRGEDTFEEIKPVDKPQPRLTEEEKERIRNEIEADNNSALARRMLELLDKRRGGGK